MGAVKKELENNTLRRLDPLSSLSPAGLDEVVQKTVMEEIPAGQYVFRVGDNDNQLVYLLQGKLDLMVENEVLSTVAAGSDAAGCALAPEQPRQVSARAKTPVTVARIDTNLVDMLLNWGESSGYEVADIGSQDSEDWISRLLQTEIFGRLPPSNIQQVLRRIEPVPVEEGKVVIRQGDDGDYFYIIKKGRCVVSRKPSPRAKPVKLAELGGGDTFGEEALLSNSKRNATVTMATEGCLMRLAKQDFVELLQGSLVAEVDYIEAQRLVQEQAATWLDVRSPEKAQDGVLDDSIKLPLSKLRDKAHELDAKGLYILCCEHGRQSANAAFLLGQLGFAVRVLQGGLESIPMIALGGAEDSQIELKAVEHDGLEQALSSYQGTKLDTQQIPAGNDKTAAQPSAEVVANITEAETTALHAKLRAIRAGHELAVKKINQRVVLLEQALEQVQEQEQTAVRSRQQSEAKLRTLEQKLDATYLEVEQRTQQLQASQQALDLGQQEFDGLRQQLGESEQRLAASQADRRQQQELESKLAKDQQRADAEVAALAQQLATAKAEHSRALDEADVRLQELQGTMLAKEKKGGELVQQRQQSESEVGDLRQQVLALQEQAESSRQEWRNQRATFQDRQDTLQDQLGSTQDQLKSLESERDQLREEQDSVTAELEQGKGQLQRLKRQLDVANDQSQGQEQQWQQEQTALEQQQAELAEQWTASRDQAQRLQTRCMELEQARDIAVFESGEHKESLELLRKQLSSTESSSEDEVQSLRIQLKDLQQRLDTATQEHEEALDRWEKEAADREEKHASICVQLETAQQALTTRAEESQNTLQSLQQEAKKLRASLQESSEQINSLEQHSDKQRLDLASGQKQYEDALQSLQLAQEQRVTAQRQYAELQASLADTQEVSQKERVRWQQQLDDAFIERDGIKTCLQESETSRREMDSHFEELEQQLAKVNEELTETQGRLVEEQENGLQMREQMESEAAKIHGLTNRLEEIQKLREQDAAQGREREETLTAQVEAAVKQGEHTRVQLVKAQEQVEVHAQEQNHQLAEVSKDLEEAQQRLSEEQESALQMRETMESEASRVRGFAEELDKARQQHDLDSTEARRREDALLEKLDAAAQQSESALAELATTQLETKQNQQQIEALEKKLQEADKKLVTATSNKEELNTLYRQLELERDAAHSDTVQLHSELKQLRDESEDVRRQGEHQRTDLTEALQKLQQQSEDHDAEHERQQSEWKAQTKVSQQQYGDLEKDCNRLREERDTTRSQLDEETQALEALRLRVVALEAEGKGDFLVLRAQAETAKEQARKAMKEMEQKSMEYRSMQVELGMRQDQEAALRAEIETIKAREVKLAAKLREQMLEDGTEPVFDDEDPGDGIEDQLREQVEQLQTELEAAKESLSTADIDLQVREQVLQSELDEMLNQANSELNEVTQQLEEAQQQLESVEQESPKEEISPGGVKGSISADNQGPGDTQTSGQGPTPMIPEQGAAFGYIKEELRPWRRYLSIGGMLAIGVGLLVWFLARPGDGVMAPDQTDSVPASQALPVDRKTSSVAEKEAKSAAKEAPAATQLAEKGTQDEDVKANLSSGFSELMGEAEAKITRLRNFLIQKTQVTDELKQPDEKPTATAKPTAKANPSLKLATSRATRVNRGREIQDQLSDGSAGPVLVQLPHGSFNMGGSDSSPYFDERPQHLVRVREFAIGKYEVTFTEYDNFAESTGRELPKDQGWGRDEQPVINISWRDAAAYTHWLSEQTGHRYRLPSEAEWEYAARAGTISPHWWDGLPPDANCFDCGSSWAGVKVAPAGRFRANPFGLHDTAGNAAEWTQDCYYPNYKNAPNDGSARLEAGCNYRVVRGGNYSTPLNSVRSTKRVKQSATSKLDTLGFRVVREP